MPRLSRYSTASRSQTAARGVGHLCLIITLCAVSLLLGCATSKGGSALDASAQPPKGAEQQRADQGKALEKTRSALDKALDEDLKDVFQEDKKDVTQSDDGIDEATPLAGEASDAVELEREPIRTRKRRRTQKSAEPITVHAPSTKAHEPAPEPEPALDEADAAPAAVRMLEERRGNGPSWSRRRAIHKAGHARQELDVLLAPLGGSARALARGGGWSASGLGCPRTCELADAICESRDAICEVAKTYPDERGLPADCEWADGECQGARSLCTACLGGR